MKHKKNNDFQINHDHLKICLFISFNTLAVIRIFKMITSATLILRAQSLLEFRFDSINKNIL